MQENIDYSAHQDQIQRHIRRLERILGRYKTFDRRFTWARLASFLFIILATWSAVVIGGAVTGLLAFILTASIFVTIVVLHRRLDLWSRRFKTWKEIEAQELARLTLDWERIPNPAASISSEQSALALDLDLTGPRSLHCLVDAAVSRQGSMRLAGWLTRGEPDRTQIETRQASVRELAGLPRFRRRLALLFRTVSKEPLDDKNLLEWLQVPIPDQMLNRLLPVTTILGAANIVLLVLNIVGILPAYWLLSAFLYALIYAPNYGRIGDFLEAVMDLDSGLGIFNDLLRYLETYPLRKHPNLAKECAVFREGSVRPTQILQRIKLLTTAAGLNSNPILGFLINLILPWNFWTAVLISRYRKQMAQLLPAWLDAFHNLEALISLGTFAALHPDYCYPDIQGGAHPVIEARNMGHPLLPTEQKVCNDFRMEAIGEIGIITGSNMAGKSTFIRTVGVNLCLAYAGSPVNANAFRCLPFRLYTCIRVSDSLSDGFSYFYAEVKRLKGLLEALNHHEAPDSGAHEEPLLYLIDEIFQGTNNRERMIGSQAYVKALIGKRGVGLIATHDLELAHLADLYPLVHNYHFRDAVQEGKLVFDYTIQPGPSPTTNALTIMQMEGLPVS